jgi:predicted ATPase
MIDRVHFEKFKSLEDVTLELGPEGPLFASVPEKKGEDAALVLDHARVKRFASVVYLHLDANEMTRPSIADDESPRMRFDGSGLASTLAWMKRAAEEELAQITADLARVVPGVRRIRTLRESVTDEATLGDRFELELDEGPPVPADLVGEGTVLALGLLTKLREPNRPRLVLLDDIDRGLHIEAQAKLVQVLRDLIKLDPDLQIVCTTQSPYLLDLFEAAEVRVLALDAQRHTRAMALTAHPELDRWRYGTQTGELWATLGEAWVATRQPKKSA